MKWVVAVILSLVICIGLVYMGFRQGHNVYIAGYDQGYMDASVMCPKQSNKGEVWQPPKSQLQRAKEK